MSTTPRERTSVQVEISVDVPIEHAFRVFTERFDEIKPREHNLLTVPIDRTVLEPHVGGTIYDIGSDGSICTWARVLAYEPPHRLVFSWDISPQWQIEPDPSRTSEVEIQFIADAPRRTKVVLEHRHLDRHGDGWQGLTTLDTGDGWPLYLKRYRTAAEGTDQDAWSPAADSWEVSVEPDRPEPTPRRSPARSGYRHLRPDRRGSAHRRPDQGGRRSSDRRALRRPCPADPRCGLRVTDGHLAAVRAATGSDKGAFGIIMAASIGAGLARWDAAVRAIDEAGDASAEIERGARLRSRALIRPISTVSGARLPDAARVAFYHKGYVGAALGDWMHAVMRGPSGWTVGERELMAAMVAHWNSCTFCLGAHLAIAVRGVEPAVVDACLADYRTAPIAAPLRATLISSRR